MASHPLLHERLWQKNRDLARACLEHPFVRGLADGSLDSEAFKRYVAQDAFFLQAFLSAYALAAAKCSHQPDRVRRFHNLMGGVLDELKLHVGYGQSLGIDLENVEPLPAVSAYTDYLRRTAWSGGVDEIVAAMTPCMTLYAFLGAELSSGNATGNPYRDWIDTYSGADFAGLTGELESLLDEVADDEPKIHDAYRYAMTCELAFFSAPLESE